MAHDDSRRFTDREVALVLRKASEIDETEAATAGGGLTLEELERIAAEVGIPVSSIHKAVGDLDRGGVRLFGEASRVHQVIRAVPGELDQTAVARLIQHVEGSSPHVGVVTQAVGSTQWTASDRFRTAQVTITPAAGETRVRVVERAKSRLWRVTHFMPTMVGTALVAGTIGQFDPSSGMIAALMGAGAAAGAAVGRAIWLRLSAASKGRVNQLATELAREAEEAARGGSAGSVTEALPAPTGDG